MSLLSATTRPTSFDIESSRNIGDSEVRALKIELLWVVVVKIGQHIPWRCLRPMLPQLSRVHLGEVGGLFTILAMYNERAKGVLPFGSARFRIILPRHCSSD